jgi:ABC-2 type transport system permease protein
MGWAQATKPYAGDRWWALLLLAGASIVLVAIAFALLGIRDLGGGLVPPRPGPPEAAPALGHPEGLALRLQRGTLIAWTAGLAATAVAYGSIAQDINDFIGDNDALEDLLAQTGGSLVDSYLGTTMLTLAVIAGGFAISAALRLRSEETQGRAETLLATAMSRRRWAASHLAVALGGSALIMAVTGLVVGLTYGISVSDLDQVGRLLGAGLAFVPALWVLVGVAFALFGLVPRAIVAAWAVLVGCLVVAMFGALIGLPQWALDLSPFQHVPQMPAAGFELTPILVLTTVAAGLLGVGFAAFDRRDAGY